MNFIPSHIEIAHFAFKKVLNKNDVVIDATLGNGYDTLYLLENFHPQKLYCFDIQNQALENTKSLLKKNRVNATSIEYIQDCHSKLDTYVKMPASLIVYNLGYLPSGNKSLTTKTGTTLKSLKKALELIKPGGLISVTCYPGHAEGKKELNEITSMTKNLDPNIFFTYFYRSLLENAPCLVLISKKV